MKTTAIGVENLCVRCHAHCRYCLLSWNGKPVGVDYDRGKRFTERLFSELNLERPDLRVLYYIGYCMDGPHLPDYIRFCRSVGSPSGEFLQLNGLALRDREEAEGYIRNIASLGIRRVDLTFYGLREYHDRFAGRTGDFDLLLALLDAAGRAGVQADVSLPILRENMAETDALLELLRKYRVGRYFAFLPHGKGRGRTIEDQRLTKAEFESLSQEVRACFSPNVRYQTEAEWIREGIWPVPQTRTLTLSLTPENMDELEAMPAGAVVSMLEKMDDCFYAAIPPPAELAAYCGDPKGQKMYRLRDLLLEWRGRFLGKSGPSLHNMDDEQGHFSVRV